MRFRLRHAFAGALPPRRDCRAHIAAATPPPMMFCRCFCDAAAVLFAVAAADDVCAPTRRTFDDLSRARGLPPAALMPRYALRAAAADVCAMTPPRRRTPRQHAMSFAVCAADTTRVSLVIAAIAPPPPDVYAPVPHEPHPPSEAAIERGRTMAVCRRRRDAATAAPQMPRRSAALDLMPP